jgi:hypothetical protein
MDAIAQEYPVVFHPVLRLHSWIHHLEWRQSKLLDLTVIGWRGVAKSGSCDRSDQAIL